MEGLVATYIECGATVPPGDPVYPRCQRPKWYTLRQVGLCLVVPAILLVAIKPAGDRSLRLWFG
jgi:hypothetical protein